MPFHQLLTEQQITDGAMEAKIKGTDNAGYWVIPEDGQYRVVVDLKHVPLL